MYIQLIIRWNTVNFYRIQYISTQNTCTVQEHCCVQRSAQCRNIHSASVLLLQLSESVGSRLRFTGASRPAEGAAGLFHRPAVQGHWERSQFYLSVAVIIWSKLFLSQLSRFAVLVLCERVLCVIVCVVASTPWHCCNCYATYNQISTKVRNVSVLSVETGDFLNCEGSGLFLLQSSCKSRQRFSLKSLFLLTRLTDDPSVASLTPAGNHSCIPNAEASFPENNFLLQLSALSDINPGEVSWRAWVWSD